jgi:hypothetical protein
MIIVELNFETVFRIPATHRLIAVRSRSRAGIVAGTFWDHEEYDAMGRLVARYESFEETKPHGNVRRSGWRKFDVVGRLVAEGELPVRRAGASGRRSQRSA